MKINSFNKILTSYVLISVISKFMAGLLQIYAIYVITKMHSEEDAAIIFLLSGYAIWFQLFELGLAQTLQNKFNARKIHAHDIVRAAITHYLLLILVGIFVIATPYLSDILLPLSRKKIDPLAFSIGAAILIIASSNVVIQRFLLIMNKGVLGNFLILLQSTIVLVFLIAYQFFEIRNILAVVFGYFGAQIIFPAILLCIVFLRNKNRKIHKVTESLTKIFYDSLGFFGTGLLSAIFLGLDYFYVAHYLTDKDVVTYYFVTRVFFISFVVYYAYLSHRVRHFSPNDLMSHNRIIKSIIKGSLLVGILSVTIAGLLGLIFNETGILKILINQEKLDLVLLFCGFLYFAIRVLRDITVVLITSLNYKKILYQFYLVEIFSCLILMSLLAPTLAGKGIFLSMMLSCFFALIFFAVRFRALKVKSKA